MWSQWRGYKDLCSVHSRTMEHLAIAKCMIVVGLYATTDRKIGMITIYIYIYIYMLCFIPTKQEYTLSEYLRMSGIYWGLTVMDLMGQLHRMNTAEITEFIKSCQHECGGISASIGHDPHLLYTLSAVQVRQPC